jgi:hypothetical protein
MQRWPPHSSQGTAQAAKYGQERLEKAQRAVKTSPRNDDEKV